MATIIMDSEKVIAAAEDTIKLILEYRSATDNAAINNLMCRGTRTWYLKKYYPTYDQAIEILDRRNLLGWRSERGWGDLRRAKLILTLAKQGYPVTLNEEDCRFLFG